MQGLKNGARVGIKNYWFLVLLMVVMYVPSLVYTLMNVPGSQGGFSMTPGCIVMTVISSLILLAVIPVLFILYNEKRTIPQAL